MDDQPQLGIGHVLAAPSIEHLMKPRAQHCLWCGHLSHQHWHNPSCRQCACVHDPVCYQCGKLTSSHELPLEIAPEPRRPSHG